MYRARQQRPAPRRGIVLLVVLALLTLFAIVGISFVLYANSEANASRYARESESPPQPDMDPELLLSMFMGQLIYDTDDDTGIYSALRGHSLARNMYGYYYRQANTPDPVFLNTNPFNGIGRMRQRQQGAALNTVDPFLASLGPPDSGPDGAPFDDFYCINYQAFDRTAADAQVIHDPERPGWRLRSDRFKHAYKGGFNPPYTYPDVNNMFLAAVKAGPLEFMTGSIDPKTAGAVLIQSFHRPWLFNNGFSAGSYKYYQLNDKTNPNWTNTIGKYLTLRPRPFDHGKDAAGNLLFPYPEDPGGDVKNLINSPGYLVSVNGGTPQFANNDSLWMDLGAPVMTAPDGTKFKPLFAPLIIDLDNRINLNVHGNIRGKNSTHASNQGWGPWEVNISRVLNYPNQPNEWAQIFTDLSSGNTPIEGGRYFYNDPSSGHIPLAIFPKGQQPNTAPAGAQPHYWGPVDLDGCKEMQGNVPSDRLQTWLIPFKDGNGVWHLPSFPSVPNGYGEGSAQERLNHPQVYNFFNPFQDPPAPWGTGNANKRNLFFPISNMEALLRYGETNSPGLTSSLFRLCAQNFGDPNFEQVPTTTGPMTGGASRRQMVTTHSFGLDRNGMSAWFWGNKGADPKEILSLGQTASGGNRVLDYNYNPPLFPTGMPVPSPNPLTITGKQLQGSDFQLARDQVNQWQSDWRSANSVLGKIDLNRKLTPYPITLRTPGAKFDAANNPVVPFNLTNQDVADKFQQARTDREQFAKDILTRLMAATGAYNPVKPPVDANGVAIPPKPEHVYAVAYLAQLAVNIVDFIDGDDIMTGFDWMTFLDSQLSSPFTKLAKKTLTNGGCGFNTPQSQWVWGTELPRVLINEVYGEFDVIGGNPKNNNATYRVDLWAELYNPLSNDVQSADPSRGVAYLRLPGTVAGGGSGGGAYRLELYRPRPNTAGNVPILHRMSNPEGEPDQYFQKSPTGGQASACRVDQFKAVPGSASVPPADFILPSAGAFKGVNGGNAGFYVIGPMRDFPQEANAMPTPPVATYQDANMSYQLRQGGGDAAAQLANGQKPSDVRPTVVLQRLANPYIPFNSVTNPYVTIDFVENITLNDAVSDPKYKDTDAKPLPNRVSVGKIDPFDSISNAIDNHLRPADQLMPKNTHQPQHTFFRHNSANATTPGQNDPRLNVPFSWLPHPDRQLISPMELLTVSAYKPAELTQRFLLGNPGSPRHLAPWLPFNNVAQSNQDNNRLFRFFEFAETNDRAAGVARGGRIPGLVNLNTVWDPEILMGLIDPQPLSNDFTDADVYRPLALEGRGAGNTLLPDSFYWRLVQRRSPSLLNGTSPDYKDQPFLGYAPGVTPGPQNPNDIQHPLRGTGAADSFLRLDSQGRPLFQKIPTNVEKTSNYAHNYLDPYIQGGVVYKLFNNVTTRSNVFAVWVTVGFFQVVDDTTRPVKLGAEIGKAENRNIRHRMFAIVDRSNLTIDNDPGYSTNPPIFLAANFETNAVIKVSGQNVTVPLYSISGAAINGTAGNYKLNGSYEGMPWTIVKKSWMQMESSINPTTGVNLPQDRQVVDVYPPEMTFTTPTGQQVTVHSPTIALSGMLNPTTTSPLYMIPMGIGGGAQAPKEILLGNPGPKPGFNLRNYPSIIRYFSIIH